MYSLPRLHKPKTSNMFLVGVCVLGLLPFIAGVIFTFLITDRDFAMMESETLEKRTPEVEQYERPSDIKQPRRDVETRTPASAEHWHGELDVSEWMSVVGGINSILMGWAVIFFRMREKKSLEVKL